MATDPSATTGGLGGLGGFASQMYTDYLGRPATAAEASPWDGSAGHTANDLLTQLTGSQEGRNYQVNNDYAALLGRPADAAGLAFYSDPNNYGSAWSSLQNSSEGKTYALDNLYENFLNRAPDQAGMDYWSNPANFANAINGGIANSDEAHTNTVNAMYKALGLNPDAPGVSYWSSAGNFDNAFTNLYGAAKSQNPNFSIDNVLSGLGDGVSSAAAKVGDPYANNTLRGDLQYQAALDNPNNGQAWNGPAWGSPDPSKGLAAWQNKASQPTVSLNQLPMPTDAEKLAIARMIYGEAGGETDPNALAAIASVVRNRQGQVGWAGDGDDHLLPFGNRLTTDNANPLTGDPGGILKKSEFNGALNPSFDPNSTVGKTILDTIDQVWSGQLADPTQGALNYWNPKTTVGTPNWVNVLAKYRDPTPIGNHVFYGRVSPDVFKNLDGSYSLPSWFPDAQKPKNLDINRTDAGGNEDTGTPTGPVNLALRGVPTNTTITSGPNTNGSLDSSTLSAIQQLQQLMNANGTTGSSITGAVSPATSIQQLLNQNGLSIQSLINALSGSGLNNSALSQLLSGSGISPTTTGGLTGDTSHLFLTIPGPGNVDE